MIYLPEEDIFIKDPEAFEEMTTEIKNWLRENMRKGRCLVEIPERITESTMRRQYKVGFLHDLLQNVYPENTKTENFSIISEKFHLFCAYRQLSNLLKPYEKRRLEYLAT